jgi:hypothetical protein
MSSLIGLALAFDLALDLPMGETSVEIAGAGCDINGGKCHTCQG